MKELLPNDSEGLKHVFEKQIFGFAPTGIMYKVAESFILGFGYVGNIKKHSFRKVDSLGLVKNGMLKEKLAEIFIE